MASANLRRGVMWFVLGGCMFTMMDVMAKLLTTRVDTVQTLWARYTVQMVLVTILIAPRWRRVLATRHPKLQAARSAFLLGATLLFFWGYEVNELAETIAIMQLSPVVVTLGAAFFLGERMGWSRLTGLSIGLIGALIIIRPGTSAFTPWALLPLGGMLCYSAYALATRFVGRDEDEWTSLFYSALLATVLLSLAVPFRWEALEPSDLPYLLGVGGFGAAGQLMLIRALTMAQASALAPFMYVQLIVASVLQVAIFGIWPDAWVGLGAAVIVAAGLLVWAQDAARAERPSHA